MLRSSAYLDMLHDRPRAKSYATALKIVLEQQQQQKRKGKKERLCVLEIGAGSGLLSCLAAKSLSDDAALAVSVVACEQFPPMATLARRVLQDNGLGEEEARVYCCRSEDLEVAGEGREGGREREEGKGFLLPARADVVVSEILDSLLVGEGVLPVMRDACSRGLMTEDAVAIPSRGRVFVQAVRCRALGLAGAAAAGGGEEEEEGKGGGMEGPRRRRCTEDGSRCPVPWHLDPLFLSGELVPLGEPAVLLDLDLARPKGKKARGANGKKDGDGDEDDSGGGGGGGVVVIETSTVGLFPESGEDDDESASASASAPASASASSSCNYFDALAFWWEVDLAPGVSLSTAPCWTKKREKKEEEEEEEEEERRNDETWTDHWRSCWVPVPLCRRRRLRRYPQGGGRKKPFLVRGIVRDTEISVEVLPEEAESEEDPEEEEQRAAENISSSCPCSCSVPSLYSPSGDWGWGTARGSPAALLLEEGANAAVARAAAAAAAPGGTAAKEAEDGAACVLVLGDGHGAASAAAATAAAAASAGRKESDLRILALQPSRAGSRAVERFAGSSSSSSSCSSSAAAAAAAAAVGRVEARLLSNFLSPSSVPAPPAVAVLAEPHYRVAEADNLPWRLLDFWPRRDELLKNGLLLPLPPSSSSTSTTKTKFSVTSPARACVVVAAISCEMLSRNYGGALKEIEGVSMRLVDEAFGRGIREEEGEEEGGKKEKRRRGARALFSRPLWQCGGAKEVSPRAELFSKQQQQQLDISAKRAAELLPASDEVELEIAEGEEIVHGVACWLRFEAAKSSPTATTEPTTADFWAPDPSGAPCPGSQAILLFHQPWRREGESKEKKTLRVRVTLSLDKDGKKVDGEVAAF